MFVADGRFHLESLMIRNPHVPAFRYDPYSKRLTSEKYDTRQLHRLRRRAVAAAANASRVGLVLGALGRQGSPAILKRVRSLLTQRGIAHFCLILTEVTPDTLKRFDAHVDAWVQVACPRLSVDWGHHFSKPTLSPYEAHVAWGSERWDDGHYPMDYYARSVRERGAATILLSSVLLKLAGFSRFCHSFVRQASPQKRLYVFSSCGASVAPGERSRWRGQLPVSRGEPRFACAAFAAARAAGDHQATLTPPASSPRRPPPRRPMPERRRRDEEFILRSDDASAAASSPPVVCSRFLRRAVARKTLGVRGTYQSPRNSIARRVRQLTVDWQAG